MVPIGRCDRGDAAAGLVVADIVARRVAGQVAVAPAVTTIGGLIACWQSDGTVFVVEALDRAGQPGLVHRVEPLRQPLAQRLTPGPGGVELDDAVTAARRLDRLPRTLVVYGIEGRWFSPRAGVSPEVAAAAHDVAERILAEVAAGPWRH